MVLLALILLVLLFGGLGFTLHLLWIVAIVWLIFALFEGFGRRSRI